MVTVMQLNLGVLYVQATSAPDTAADGATDCVDLKAAQSFKIFRYCGSDHFV
jgi:hypothetical protein